MSTGVVKWYNSQKKYGFIRPNDQGGDIFVHISALEKAGLTTLNEGDKVTYDVAIEKGKSSAVNIRII